LSRGRPPEASRKKTRAAPTKAPATTAEEKSSTASPTAAPGPERESPHDHRRQHPLRTGSARPGPGPGRHRGPCSFGTADRTDRRHRPRPSILLKVPSPLPRIRPCPEHRLQHPRRWPPPRTHRVAPATMRSILNALGAVRIPDPHQRAIFCRRFHEADVLTCDGGPSIRPGCGSGPNSPRNFFHEAIVDVDGTPRRQPMPSASRASTSPTTGNPGAIYTLGGLAGQHGRGCSLPWSIAAANRPSHEGAPVAVDKAIALCRRAGFRRICLRGDTDFQPDRASRPLGRCRRRPLPVGIDAHPHAGGAGRGAAGRGVQLPGATARGISSRRRRVSDPSHLKPEIVRERGFVDDPHARGDGGRIRLSPVWRAG